MQKLYCYVDESGQDVVSQFFIVLTIITEGEQESIREKLEYCERVTGTNNKKWHKVRNKNRVHYLKTILKKKIAAGGVYIAYYKKPIPYFFPIIDILEKAIKATVREKYRVTIYIDGIDKFKAKELTNALRARTIALRFIKSRRDESEPLIRLADMWAGCIRSALLGIHEAKVLFDDAVKIGYLVDVTK